MKKRKTILFPGRHLFFTKFQEEYLLKLATSPIHLVFIVTSGDLSSCRYSPIDLQFRLIQIDRFCRSLKTKIDLTWTIAPVPHYTGLSSKNFIERCIEHVKRQDVSLNDAEVVISTPHLKRVWKAFGFITHNCELSVSKENRFYPSTVLEKIVQGEKVDSLPASDSTKELLCDYPNVSNKIKEIWSNPTTATGALTEKRDYSSYGLGMQNNIHVKFQQIRPFILEGNISDEGCADGALIAEMCKEFGDSQFYGIDLSNTFETQFNQRRRLGHFRGLYAEFILGDLLKNHFKDNSINTSICNSTIHEIYSYGGKFEARAGEACVRRFLRLKQKQICAGGRLIIRDIASPSKPEQKTKLTLPGFVRRHVPVKTDQQNIAERFLKFVLDSPWRGFKIFSTQYHDDFTVVETDQNTAHEFAHRFEYTGSWHEELGEKYFFWTFEQWKKELQEAGFLIHPVSCEITEKWLMENRFSQIENSVGWDSTHILLIAEKR